VSTTYEPAAGTGQLLVNPPFATTPVFPLTTTLNRIKACNPCDDGWQAGLQAAGKTEPDDEPISYEAILDAVGIEKALWCCQAEKQHANLWRRYAVWCARQVQHLMTDERSIAALDVAERHANNEATDSELAAAWAAAWAARAAARDAAWDAAWDAARYAAWDAAWAAARDAAKDAARVAARYAAWDAAKDAAWDAARDAAKDAAWAAKDAAWDTAWDAARDAARYAQSSAFRQLVTTGTLPSVEQRQEVAA
jgi:hypothetical protein